MARPDLSAALATHVVNPVMRPLIRRGFFPSVWTLLETTGRRSGEPRTTPVGYAREGDTVWVVAERGRASAYVKNLLADPQVRVLLDRRWRTGRATPVDDDDALAR